MSDSEDTKTGQSRVTGKYSVPMMACRKLANQHSEGLLENLFDNVDEVINDLILLEESADLKAHYSDAMTKLRENRAALLESFENHYNTSYQKMSRPDNAEIKARILERKSIGGLSLVDDDELEQQIAITNIVTSALNRFSLPLSAVFQRFAEMLGKEEIDERECPLSPRTFCEAFRDALLTTELDVKIKLILFTLFERFVVSYLGNMYGEINERLIKEGIIPDFKISIKRPRSEGNQRRNDLGKLQQELAEVTASTSVEGVDVSDMPPLDTENLHLLLKRLLIMQQPEDIDEDATKYETQDVVSALNDLQQSDTQEDYREVGDEGRSKQFKTDLANVISQQHGDEAAGVVNQTDSATVDLISMMFDVIFEDPDLPDRAKALLARLQIPMLKVAILDNELVNEKTHPARLLLNALTEAGVTVGDSDEGGGDELYMRIEEVVQAVIKDFKDDVSILQTILDDFNNYLDKERKQHQEAEQKTFQVAEAKEQRGKLHTTINNAISMRVGDLMLPSKVQAMLDGPWKKVMLSVGLSDGTESERWHKLISILDDMMLSLNHKDTVESRQEVTQKIPQLVKDLRQELEAIAYWKEDEIDAFFQDLGKYQMAILRGQRLKTQKKDVTKKATLAEKPTAGKASPEKQMNDDEIERFIDNMDSHLSKLDDLDAVIEGEGVSAQKWFDLDLGEDLVITSPDSHDQELIEDEYTDLVRVMEKGDWLEFIDDEAEKIKRAKLEWKGDIVGEYIFVNWRHQVAAEYSVASLSAALRCGSARFVDDLPMFDKALSRVMDALINTTKKEAIH